MEQKTETHAKPKAKKEISAMRKITTSLDKEVKKVEINRIKIAKFEKEIQAANERIKSLTAQLNKNFS
jgi:hypothetical protein